MLLAALDEGVGTYPRTGGLIHDARLRAFLALPADRRVAAIVGRVVAERTGQTKGQPLRLLTIEVDQRVKGDASGTLEVRSPSGSDCDLLIPRDEQIGLLLTRAPDGGWLGTECSVVAPGQLVAEGGEPRGGVIKVGVGIVILGLVLLWALRRLRRGARPELPGAPGL